MSAVWSATGRLLCLGSQNPFKRQTALSIPISTVLSGPKSFLRRGEQSGYIRPITGIARGSNGVRPICQGLGRHSRHENEVVSFRPILSQWESLSSIPERASRTHPAPELKPLSKTEIVEILGKNVSSKEGNSILRQLQHQRVSGTLDQGLSEHEPLSDRAMDWLRKNYPVDEDAAINARLDREEEENSRIDTVYKPQQSAKGTDNYSRSVFDQIKERNRLKAAKEKEARAKEEQARENAGGSTSTKTAPRAIVARRTESAEWVKKYKEKATSSLKAPPKMTKFQRLWPSTLVTFAVIGLSALFAQNYSPPSRKARLWPDIPPAAATVLTLISINVAVFLLWRIPPAWRFLNSHFSVIPAFPYSSSIVACSFSHQMFGHLAWNMIVLWLVGTPLHNDIRRGNFLAVFFTCGVVSSCASLSYYVFRNILYTSSLGASGAICGLAATYLSLDFHKPLHILFVPDWFTQGGTRYDLLCFMIALEVYGFIRRLRNPIRGTAKADIDHVAHLGGYAAGIGCAQALRCQSRHRQQVEEKKEKSTSPMMKQLKTE